MASSLHEVSDLEERPKSENKKPFILSILIFLVTFGIVYFVKNLTNQKKGSIGYTSYPSS